MYKEIKKLRYFRICSAYIEIKKVEPNPHTVILSRLTQSYFFVLYANSLLCLMMSCSESRNMLDNIY
jgi:hypothetical protein